MRIKAVFFDLGGTLVERKPEADEDSIKLIYEALGYEAPSNRELPILRRRLKNIERAVWNSYKPKELIKVKTLDAEKDFLRSKFYPAVLKRWGIDEPPGDLLDVLVSRRLGPETFHCLPETKEHWQG